MPVFAIYLYCDGNAVEQKSFVCFRNKAGNVSILAPPSQPPALSHLCRMTTNQSLRGEPYNHVKDLLVPNTVKRFLKYDTVEL